MKQFLVIPLVLFLVTAVGQNEGYEIKVNFKPFKNQYIYLGHYFGAKQYPIIDSVMLDNNSSAVFKGTKKLGRGIYLLGYPNKNGFYELLMDFNQKFTINIDTSKSRNIQFEHSEYNTEFSAYQQFMSEKGQAIANARNQRAAATNKPDSLKWTGELKKLDSQVVKFRDSIIHKNPSGILGYLLNGMSEPTIPPGPQHPGGKYDSLYAYRYYKSHYWDGINFWDDAFTRTTFFEGRLDKYFDEIVAPNADSVIKDMDRMLGFATVSPDMNRFLLTKFINRFYNQKYMWEDAVFVHLYEKYLANKDYSWMTESGKKLITDRAYSLMANILGTPAADIELPDSSGKKISLYGINAPYVLVCFWDATCGHCKETLPKIDSFYTAKWKAAGLKIYSVSKETSGTINDWKNFIQDKNLNWINVFYTRDEEKTRVNSGIPGYSQLYDVQTFPTLYLLDKDKRIIAKKLSYQQMDDILTLKLKGN
jgi:peroxiredoxin